MNRSLTPLIAFVSALSLQIGAADETEALPIYVTEEVATNALETALKESAKKASVSLDSLKPVEPLQQKGFVAVGIQINCNGSTENLTAFLASITEQPFASIPSVHLVQDRRDPSVFRSAISLWSWYAAKEKSVSKLKKWNRIAKPSPAALALYEGCTAKLPENGVAITSFTANDGTITLIGTSHNANVGRTYGAKLFASEDFPGYKWVWLQRPAVDARRKDGTATFRIQGTTNDEASS